MDLSEYDKMYHLEEANWWYSSRRDLVLRMIANLDSSPSGKHLDVLDTGCGSGINLKYIQTFGNSYGLDISKNALRLCRIRGLSSLICGSSDSLPFKKGLFDLVLALDVIEHIDDDQSAVREIYRVLRPGGHLIVTVPAFPLLWSGHDVAVHHKRRYTRSTLLDTLRSSGFAFEKATYWNCLLFPPVAMIRLAKRLYGKRDEMKDDLKSDLAEMPPIVNGLLRRLLGIENSIIEKIDLPFGVSVMCICRKACDDPDETK